MLWANKCSERLSDCDYLRLETGPMSHLDASSRVKTRTGVASIFQIIASWSTIPGHARTSVYARSNLSVKGSLLKVKVFKNRPNKIGYGFQIQ